MLQVDNFPLIFVQAFFVVVTILLISASRKIGNVPDVIFVTFLTTAKWKDLQKSKKQVLKQNDRKLMVRSLYS